MIETTLDNLILLNLLAGIFLIGIVWLGSLLLQLIKIHRRKKTHIRCRLCSYKFLNENKQKYVACPLCGGVNEVGAPNRH